LASSVFPAVEYNVLLRSAREKALEEAFDKGLHATEVMQQSATRNHPADAFDAHSCTRYELLPAKQQPRWCIVASLVAAGALVVLALVQSGANTLLLTDGSTPDKIIYIIRHGEKIFDATNHSAYDYACMSEQGWARAYNLKAVFGPRPQPPFRTPQALFSANYGDPGIDCRDEDGWYRTQQIIAPLAAPGRSGLDLTINNHTGWLPHLCSAEVRGDDCFHDPDPNGEPHGFGMCCNTHAASTMKETLMRPGVDTVLVAWEHWNIPFLALALGATFPTAGNRSIAGFWPGEDFDRVYALHYSRGGRFLRLETDLFQGLTHLKGRWLGPSSGCGAIAPWHYARHHSAWDESHQRWHRAHPDAPPDPSVHG
jgi:hypothetical protein